MSTAEIVAPGLPLPARLWSVDPQSSEIGFAVKALGGLQTVRGVFRACDGTLSVLDGGASGRLTIEAASLDTGNARRDKHLRSADFFDVERHPHVVFTTTAVAPRDDGVIVSGELVVGASTAELQIPLEVEHDGDGAIRLRGEATVAREAVGLRWNKLGIIAREATLHARLTLRPESP